MRRPPDCQPSTFDPSGLPLQPGRGRHALDHPRSEISLLAPQKEPSRAPGRAPEKAKMAYTKAPDLLTGPKSNSSGAQGPVDAESLRERGRG